MLSGKVKTSEPEECYAYLGQKQPRALGTHLQSFGLPQPDNPTKIYRIAIKIPA